MTWARRDKFHLKNRKFGNVHYVTPLESPEFTDCARSTWIYTAATRTLLRKKKNGMRKTEREEGQEEDEERSCHSAAYKLYEILIMAPLVGRELRHTLERLRRRQVPRDRRWFVNPRACRLRSLLNKFLAIFFLTTFLTNLIVSLAAMMIFRYLHDRLINLVDLPRVIRYITLVIIFGICPLTWHLKRFNFEIIMLIIFFLYLSSIIFTRIQQRWVLI